LPKTGGPKGALKERGDFFLQNFCNIKIVKAWLKIQ